MAVPFLPFTWPDITTALRRIAETINAILSGNARDAIGLNLYPRTAAEIAASITPTNYWYPEGYVDRYGTNTTPGTTDMTAAFNAARDVAEQNVASHSEGGIICFLGTTYLMTNTLRQGMFTRSIGVGPLPTLVSFSDAVTGQCWKLERSDGTYVFGSTIENLKIRVGTNATYGVFSVGAHQHSGLKRVTISNVRQIAMQFGSSGGPARLENEVWIEASASAYMLATTLSTDEITNDTEIHVASATGFASGQYISIELDSGAYHHTKISNVSGSSIFIANGLPSAAATGNDLHLSRIGALIANGSINKLPMIDVEGNASYPFDICVLQEAGHCLIDEFHTEYSRDGIVCAGTNADSPSYVQIGTATGSDTVSTVVHVRSTYIGAVRIGLSTGGDQAGNSNLINDITGHNFAGNPVANYEYATPAGINDKPRNTQKWMPMRHDSTTNWDNVGHVVDVSTTVAGRIYAPYLMRNVNSGSPLNAAGIGMELNSGGYYDLLLGAADSAGALDAKVRIRGNSLIDIINGLGNYANDAAAAAGGVPIGSLYRNGSIVMIRVA